jgi:hypothetical protein
MQITRIFYTETEAAEFLSAAVDTLRVWRSKSRRTGRLIGPRWTEVGGTGKARMIRYRLADLENFLLGGLVSLEPAKRRGRPRKATETATAVTSTL